jgi:hypothetical protein
MVGKRIDAIAYLRPSSAANVGSDKDSDKRQRAAIASFAKAHGYRIVDEFYDATVSGADPVAERPGFKAMLDRMPAMACASFSSRAPTGLRAISMYRSPGTTICARSGSSWCRRARSGGASRSIWQCAAFWPRRCGGTARAQLSAGHVFSMMRAPLRRVQRSAVKHQFKRIAVAVAASREGHRLRGSDREGQRRRWGRGQKPTVVQGGRNNSWR